MQARIRLAGLGAVAALAFVSPATAQQTPSKAMPAAESACTVALTPQSLKVQADPFEVKGILSQAIGTVSSASIKEQDSGIEVAVTPASDAGEPQVSSPKPPAAAKPADAAQAAPAAPAAEAWHALQLTLKTATAKPGDWTLAIEGANGMCTGKLHVDAGEPKK